MYFRILKRDLKRKKTMNVILFLFIIFATTFIASSVNNILSISTAMDSYFEKAEVPDYWICAIAGNESNKIEKFVKNNGYSYRKENLLCYEAKSVKKNGKKIDYTNTFSVSNYKTCMTNIFNTQNEKVTNIKDGEIYITTELMNSCDVEVGDKLSIGEGDKKREFIVKGNTKDALFGSSMVGITRCLVNENDYNAMKNKKDYCVEMYGVHENNIDAFIADYEEEEFSALFADTKDLIKTTYIMDMVIAAVLLIVSICLIIISLVILRFTIVFTMNEEFREIGVMKALGIKSQKIRGLYIAKYFAMSLIGGAVGFVISIPFGNMLLQNVSKNIVMQNDNQLLINFVAALLIIMIVVLFCYFCTRKINSFKPVDAIRNGSNGERFKAKGVLKLSRGRIRPVCFMAMNDIMSEFRKFAILLLAFTLGILLIIIPVNTANTLRSDTLITCFSMKESDVCIADEIVVSDTGDVEAKVDDWLQSVKDKLKDENIDADVYRECFFKARVSYKDRKCSSLAFQGKGDVKAADYTYMEGEAPKYENEVAITHVIQDRLQANIGDEIEIRIGDTYKKYIITGLFQTMNNMGEGIRFLEKENLDYSYLAGSFATQILYKDQADEAEKERRLAKIKEIFSDASVYTSGEYISHMIGDIASQIDSVKQMIVLVVLLINILVTVLMVKSFIAKEKGEIGMLKAIGFENSALIRWQTLRIGMVLVASTIIATAISTPLTKLSSGQVFKMMGLQTIEFEIVPMEVYVFYPVIIILVTVLASILTAQGIRKISATETSNIE